MILSDEQGSTAVAVSLVDEKQHTLHTSRPLQKRRKSFAEVAAIVASQISGKPIGHGISIFHASTHCASLIVPRLYLSDFATACDGPTLKKLGVTHVVSVIETAPSFRYRDGLSESLNLKKLHIPLTDQPHTNILRHLDETTAFITEALRDPHSVVLVSES